jgi:hypothetical protein
MSKQLFPDAVGASRPRLFFGDKRLTLWASLAVGSAFAIRLYRHETPGQTGLLPLTLSLLPLIPAYLYARRLVGWIADLDEMQRRIQKDALIFAAMWTVFLRMALDHVRAAGYFTAPSFGQDIGVDGTFAVMCFLYMLGCVVANRRYQ